MDITGKRLRELYTSGALAYEAMVLADIAELEKTGERHVFSAGFEKEIAGIANELDRPRGLSPASKRMIALIAAIIAALLAALSVSAVRESIFRLFFVERTGSHAVIQYAPGEGEDAEIPEVTEDFRSPSYIPEGYIQTDELFWTDYHSVTYTKGVVSYSFEQTRIGSATSVSLEKAEAVTEKIKGREVLMVIEGHELTAYWCDDRYEYHIIGTIERDEAEKVIESMM